MLYIQDIEAYGFKLQNDIDDETWLFKNEQGLLLMYNRTEGWLRVRKDRSWGFHAVIIHSMKVSNKQELDFVLTRSNAISIPTIHN